MPAYDSRGVEDDMTKDSSCMALAPLVVGLVPVWAYCVQSWQLLEQSEIGVYLHTNLDLMVSCL